MLYIEIIEPKKKQSGYERMKKVIAKAIKAEKKKAKKEVYKFSHIEWDSREGTVTYVYKQK